MKWLLAVPVLLAFLAVFAADPEPPAALQQLETMLQQKKYSEAVKLADEALKEAPGDFRLIAVKSFTQFKYLNDRKAAFATVDKALAEYPKLYDLYDFKIELIKQAGGDDVEAGIMEVYRGVAKNFADKPLQISDIGLSLLKQPLGEVARLEPALLLLSTARANSDKLSAQERYVIGTNLARGYYFSSRADLAAAEQSVANALADNEVDRATGEKLLAFYNEAARMAGELSNVAN